MANNGNYILMPNLSCPVSLVGGVWGLSPHNLPRHGDDHKRRKGVSILESQRSERQFMKEADRSTLLNSITHNFPLYLIMHNCNHNDLSVFFAESQVEAFSLLCFCA